MIYVMNWIVNFFLSKTQLPDICLCQSKIYRLFQFPCDSWLEIKTRILTQLKLQLLLHSFNKRLLLMLTPKWSFVITGLSTQYITTRYRTIFLKCLPQGLLFWGILKVKNPKFYRFWPWTEVFEGLRSSKNLIFQNSKIKV